MAGSQPKTVRPGQPMSAKLFNQQNRSLQTATGVAPGLEKRQIGKSVSLAQKEDSRSPTFPTQIIDVVVSEVKEDYLICYRYSEYADTTSSQIIYVAKQRRFRPSLYDGVTIDTIDGDSVTYTKDATTPEWKREADNGTAYTQRVIPCWYVDEVISIRAKKTNLYTDVADGEISITWEELEPRIWAVEIP